MNNEYHLLRHIPKELENPMHLSSEYKIYLGDTLIGYAKDVTCDMPNIIGVFEPTEAFPAFADLFERFYAAIGSSQEWNKLRNDMFLLNPRIEMSDNTVLEGRANEMPGTVFSGKRIAYLYVRGNKVWWRPM